MQVCKLCCFFFHCREHHHVDLDGVEHCYHRDIGIGKGKVQDGEILFTIFLCVAENLLLNGDSSILKLCDFGCARKMHARMQLTEYIATRWYRAPELHIGTSNYDFAVDVWAVGCIMAEMVDGKPLFPCKDDMDGVLMIHRAFGLPQHVCSSIVNELIQICTRHARKSVQVAPRCLLDVDAFFWNCI